MIVQRIRGYGNAYRAGFAAARGEVIATGDSDCTYPFYLLPELLSGLYDDQLDFLSTNRSHRENRRVMKPSQFVANLILSGLSRAPLRIPFVMPNPGCGCFRRKILDHLDLTEEGLGFRQEIKAEGYLKGFRCAEARIGYKVRGRQVKLHAVLDAVENIMELVLERTRAHRLQPQATVVQTSDTPAEATSTVVSSLPQKAEDETLYRGALSAAPAHLMRRFLVYETSL